MAEYSPCQHNLELQQSSLTQFLSCSLCLKIRRGVWFSHPDKSYDGMDSAVATNNRLDRCCALCVASRYLSRGEHQPLILDRQTCCGCGDYTGEHEPYSQRLFGEYFCIRCVNACLGRNIQTAGCGPFIRPYFTCCLSQRLFIIRPYAHVVKYSSQHYPSHE